MAATPQARTNSEPARGPAEAISLASDYTPSAGLNGSARAIWVGTGGHVKVDVLGGGTGIIFKNHPGGGWLEVTVTKVYSTANGTTASDLVAVS